MRWDKPKFELLAHKPTLRWQVAWLVALTLGGLVTGLVTAAASTDWPAWYGTDPAKISGSLPSHGLYPALASDLSGLMVAAWSNPSSEEAPRDIYIVHSTDDGHTWSEPAVISATTEDSLLPDVVIAGDRVHVVWAEGDPRTGIYAAEGAIGGDWEVREIPSALPLNPYTRPTVAADGGRLHVAFNAGNSEDILYSARPLTATTWPTATAAYTHATSNQRSRHPVLATNFNGETLHLAWQESFFLEDEDVIMYMQGQVDGGDVSWASAETISSRDNEMIKPDILVDSVDGIYIVWGEVGVGDIEEQYIRYTRHTDGTWLTPTVRITPERMKVNDQSPYYIAPRLALWETSGRLTLCAVWHGFQVSEIESVEEVFLSCSEDEGASWSTPWNVSRSSDDGETLSIRPAIAFGTAGHQHIVWEERVGPAIGFDHEIYHSYAANRIFLPLTMRS